MKILGIDLGLRCTGFATQDGDSIVRGSYFETRKDKRKNVRVGNDDHRRCRELLKAINDTINIEQPDIIGIEMPTGSQSARGAKAAGLVIGVVAGIDFLSVTPMEVKLAFCMDKKASKDQMVAQARKVTQIPFGDFKKDAREAIADAAGVIFALKWLNEFKMIEKALNKNIILNGGIVI